MRLGDNVDDYCSRCKLPTNHDVVSLFAEDIQKVRCRTCNFEHNYRHNKGGRGQMTPKQAFDKVLASVMGSHAEGAPVKKLPAKKQRAKRRPTTESGTPEDSSI